MNYEVRRADISDLPRLQRLFYHTVTSVGLKAYTKAEINIWTRHASDKSYWEQKFIESNFYIALLNGEILGFISLNTVGYIDYIYVAHNYQGKGIASLLYEKIEHIALENEFQTLYSDVSYLAKSFFEKNGFDVIKKNEHHIDGEVIVNFSVRKVLS